MSLATEIRQLADRYENLSVMMFSRDENDLGIVYRQISAELITLILDKREASMPNFIECKCKKLNHYSRNYCDCGNPVEPF